MMDTDRRVVRVFCEFSDGRPPQTGSGYLLDGGLVLTSAHVVGRSHLRSGLPKVECAGGSGRFDCVIEWHVFQPDLPERARVDAALLRIADPSWLPPRDLPPLRWGRLVTNRTDISVRLTGFPTAMNVHDERSGMVIRDSVPVSAVVDTGTATKGQRYHLTVNDSIPLSSTAKNSRWEGACGAAVTCHGLVIGVTAEAQVEPDWAWMSAVPSVVLLTDPEFRNLVGSPVAEAAELQPILEQTGTRPPYSPISLIRPENEVVGFDRGCDDVIDRLRQWCTEDGWFSIRLVIGPGGQRKTRLAARLIAVMRELGWGCGFLVSHATMADLAVVGELTSESLLVIDCADVRAGQLVELVEVLDRRARGVDATGRVDGAPPARVLLLARSVGDWWEEARSFSRLLRDLGTGLVVSLPDLPE